MIYFKVEDNKVYFKDRYIDTKEHFLNMLTEIILSYKGTVITTDVRRANGATLFVNADGKRIVLKDDMLLNFINKASYEDLGSKSIVHSLEYNPQVVRQLTTNSNALVTYNLYNQLEPNVKLFKEESKVFLYEFALYNNLNSIIISDIVMHLPYLNKLYILEFFLACKKLGKDFKEIEQKLVNKDIWGALRDLGVSYLPSSVKNYDKELAFKYLKEGYNFSLLKSHMNTAGVKCGAKMEELIKEVRPKSKLYKYFVEGSDCRI